MRSPLAGRRAPKDVKGTRTGPAYPLAILASVRASVHRCLG